jgi:hypothetical protein
MPRRHASNLLIELMSGGKFSRQEKSIFVAEVYAALAI